MIQFMKKMSLLIVSITLLFFGHSIATVPAEPTVDTAECQTDGECAYVKLCAQSCEPGLGPLCAYSNCINGKCVVTYPCTKKDQCTEKDVSRCVFEKKCAKCSAGYSPGCTTAVCENSQCKIIEPCTFYEEPVTVDTTTMEHTTITEGRCIDNVDCINAGPCVSACPTGFGPLCSGGVCENGRCKGVPPCSLKSVCSGDNAGQCEVPQICATCRRNFYPTCAEARCSNGQCHIDYPCTMYTSTLATSPRALTTTPSGCQKDTDCVSRAPCAFECPEGFGPLCPQGRCINNQCSFIFPCEQKSVCTATNISQCVVPPICAECFPGFGPGCAAARCENGECKIIQPCSIRDGTATSTLSTVTITRNVCTGDKDCPRSSKCVSKCKNGTTPLCAAAKCVDGKCIDIPPCSQISCKVASRCPYNKMNCAKCHNGYGPACERPACKCGVCTIIPPCSRKNLVTSMVAKELD